MWALLHDSRALEALAALPAPRPDLYPASFEAQRLARQRLALAPRPQQGPLALHCGDDLAPRAATLAAAASRAAAAAGSAASPAAEGAGLAAACAAAEWRARMAALHAEGLALRAAARASSAALPACRAAYALAAARGARLAPARAHSTRHVATAWGAREGRSARGAAPPPPARCSGPVEEAIAGRRYCAWAALGARAAARGASPFFSSFQTPRPPSPAPPPPASRTRHTAQGGTWSLWQTGCCQRTGGGSGQILCR